MSEEKKFEISQAYCVIKPNPDKAYPIPCAEWNYLKGRIGKIEDRINFYHTTGSILLGAGASTFIAIVSGGFADPDSTETPTGIIIAWACVAVTFVTGIISMCFALEKRKMGVVKSSDVIAHMEVIENRFEEK